MEYRLAKHPKLPWEAKLPKGIEEYCHDTISHPIVYDRFKKKAFCFSCGQYFCYEHSTDPDNLQNVQARTIHVMDKFKADDYINCPLCCSQQRAVPHTRNCFVGTMVATGRREKEKIYIMIINAMYYFKKEDFGRLNEISAEIHLEEIAEISRKSQRFALNWGGSWSELKQPYIHEAITREHPKYHQSFIDAIEKGFLRFAGIAITCDINILTKRIAVNAKYPQLEYLKKAGLGQIENAMVYGQPTYIKPNWNKSDLPGLLRLTNQDLDKLRQWGMWDVEHIAAYQQIKKFHRKVRKQDMTDLFLVFDDIGIFVANQPYGADLRGMDPVKISRYLEKVYKDNPPTCSQGAYGYNRNNVIREYNDYLKQAQELEYPMTDYYLYPKDFFAAHDKISAELREKKDKEVQEAKQTKQKKYEDKYLPALQKLAWGDGKYFIRPLADYQDFSIEGKNNINCVASYYDRAAEGKTAIFVIREKLWPDKSLATVEVQNGKIVQCRAKGNSAPSPEVRAFADRWIKEIVNTKKRKGAA